MTVKIHPWHNRVTFDFDVALLKLKKNIVIDDYKKQEITLANYGEILPLKTPVRKLDCSKMFQLLILNLLCKGSRHRMGLVISFFLSL